MKKILSINVANYGSTGNIMRGISELAEKNGYECWQAYAPDKINAPGLERDIVVASYNIRRINERYARYTGMRGYQAYFSTKLFLKKIDRIAPDIIHLHNLHNNYIHVGLLFDYIKKNDIKVVWTLHDCWAFTGRCPHFEITGCEKWISGCYECQYPANEYPSAKKDRTAELWRRKKESFSGVKNMTLVTPSEWLSGLVKQSFLKEYETKVINNGIDLGVFRPTESDFRKKHSLGDKFVVLGVSFGWNKRKGIDVFAELASRLDERFAIVLVGTYDLTDKMLPENIITIHRTDSQRELAEIYSSADVFVDPTREDNFPTVVMEALACGTPAVVFNTGGCPEIISENCGYVVEKDDICDLVDKTVKVCVDKPFDKEDCVTRAESFDRQNKFKEYVDLYNSI